MEDLHKESAAPEAVPATLDAVRERGREKLRRFAESTRQKVGKVLGGAWEGTMNAAALAIEGKTVLEMAHNWGTRMDERALAWVAAKEKQGIEKAQAMGRAIEAWKSDVWHGPGRMMKALGEKLQEERNKAAVRAVQEGFEGLTPKQKDRFLAGLQQKFELLLEIPAPANENGELRAA